MGILGAASLMKSAGVGGLGVFRSTIADSSSNRSPLRRLHGAQEVTTFSQTESPPRLRGTTWSSVSRPEVVPQYTQRQPSRANRARREIFRWTARGTFTYWTSRITCGHGYVLLAERRGCSSSSITSALPLNTSTCARLTDVTFSGS